MMWRRKTFLLVGLTLVTSLVGLPTFAASDSTEAGKKLILAEEPADAMTLAQARGKLGLEPKPVVIVGRIGGKEADPFLEGKASFSLIEVPADDHALKPGHDADSCPFCKKRRANATMAAIQFLGEDGKPLPVDARKLFGIEKGQDVVIRGTGVFNAKLGVPIIQVNADGIFVREKAK